MYWTWADQPSYRLMASRSRHAFAASTLHAALHGTTLPSLAKIHAVQAQRADHRQDPGPRDREWPPPGRPSLPILLRRCPGPGPAARLALPRRGRPSRTRRAAGTGMAP